MSLVVESVDDGTLSPVCNVCGSDDFIDFRTRPKARCNTCASMERSRILQLIFDEEQVLKPGMTVLHLAPEEGIARNIRKIVGDGYEARDLNPRLFSADLEVQKFDLLVDTENLPSEKYDIVLHSHVMEHIPCDVTSIMWHLHRSLKPTGLHIFCVPIMSGAYGAEFGSLTREERTRRYGQFDHVRRFGSTDFYRIFGMAFNLAPYKVSDEMRAKFPQFRIPSTLAVELDSNSFFFMRKNDLKLR